MRYDTRDMTIDGILADPMIRAAMRADRVDPRDLETLLRTFARRLAAETPPRPTPFGPAVRMMQRASGAAAGACLA